MDGLTGLSVAASVAVGGMGAGAGTTLAVSAVPGTMAEFSAGGYLTRRVVVGRAGALTAHLWPDRPGLEAERTRELLYLDSVTERPAVLARLTVPTAYVHLDPAVATVENTAVLAEATRRVSEAARWLTMLPTTTSPPDDAVVCTVTVDPELDGSALAARELGPNGEIVGARIRVARAELLENLSLMVHELGHFFGLRHLRGFDGIMSGDARAHAHTDFTRSEADVAWLVQFRDPRNRFPDDGSGAGSTSSTGPREETVCRFLRVPD